MTAWNVDASGAYWNAFGATAAGLGALEHAVAANLVCPSVSRWNDDHRPQPDEPKTWRVALNDIRAKASNACKEGGGIIEAYTAAWDTH